MTCMIDVKGVAVVTRFVSGMVLSSAVLLLAGCGSGGGGGFAPPTTPSSLTAVVGDDGNVTLVRGTVVIPVENSSFLGVTSNFSDFNASIYCSGNQEVNISDIGFSFNGSLLSLAVAPVSACATPTPPI